MVLIGFRSEARIGKRNKSLTRKKGKTVPWSQSRCSMFLTSV